MAENLLESLGKYVTPDLISQASSMLGESEGGISKGMNAAIPSLLGGLVGKADSSDVMDGIMGMVNQKGFDADSILSDLPSLLSGKGNKSVMDSGGNMLNMLFGNNQSGMIDMLANSAGIKSSSAKAMMGMAAPMVLGYIKKSGFNASSLVSSLLSQKKDITSMLPKGMNSLMGFGEDVGDEVKKRVGQVTDSVTEKPKNKWLWPLIIIGALLVIFYLMRNCGGETDTPATNTIETETTQGIYGKATQMELDESYEVGANPDAATIAKFEEKAGKKFSMYRAYDYDDDGWLSASWETDLASAAKKAADRKAKTGHNTGVRWK